MVQEQRPLQRFELGKVLRELCEERVGEYLGHLFVTLAVAIAHQLADVDLKGCSQTLERSEGRNGLAVFDLGDVGAGNLHAAGELPLAEVTSLANVLDLSRHAKTGVLGAGRAFGWGCDLDGG